MELSHIISLICHLWAIWMSKHLFTFFRKTLAQQILSSMFLFMKSLDKSLSVNQDPRLSFRQLSTWVKHGKYISNTVFLITLFKYSIILNSNLD